jgi:hypothetical protein
MHAICHYKNGRPDNLSCVDVKQGLYSSGFWRMTPDEAGSLEGGWLYLHESSREKPCFVAKIVSVGERDAEGKYELTIQKQRVMGNSAWRGKVPGPSRYISIVPATYPSETQSVDA